MPYKSEAQRRFFNSPAGKDKIGEEEVEHWNEVSKGMKLPGKAIDIAINSCDVLPGQIDIWGNVHNEQKPKKREYRVSYILPGRRNREFEFVEAYSEEQAKGYVSQLLHKRGIHKFYDMIAELS